MNGPRRVYSSGPGGPDDAWSDRDAASRRGAAEPREDLAPDRHALKVRLDRGGRKGKQVTVAGPLILRPESARALLAEMKRNCGSGGTLRLLGEGEQGFELEIQGDQRDRLCAVLADRGYPVKRAGG